MSKLAWNGKAVFVMSTTQGKPIGMALSEEAARKLALMLAKQKQTYFLGLEPQVQELLDALNYVLVADPASVAAHSRMEAGKGMTPDGGYKQPEQPEQPYQAYARGISDSGNAAKQQPFPNPPRDGAGFIRPEDRHQ